MASFLVNRDKPRHWRWPSWGSVFLAVLAIKIALLLLDPHVRFFFGDSEAYLHAATRGWGKPDRSSTYPFFIWLAVLPTGSMLTLIWLQTLFGAVVCVLCYWLLRGPLAVHAWLAAGAALALAIEPMQLYYERSVMAECLGTLFLMLMTGCTTAYFLHRRPLWLALAACLGMGAVSFRMNLLPTVLVVSSFAPALWLFARPPSRPARGMVGMHLAFAIVATFGVHSAYKLAYGRAVGIPPAYLAHESYFKLAWLAPLIEPTYLEEAGMDSSWLAQLPIDPRQRRSREAQLWNPNGLIPRFRAEAGKNAAPLAAAISNRILREQPLQVVRLGWLTLLDHFDAPYARERFDIDLGALPPSAIFVGRWQRELNYDASDWRHREGIVYRMFAASRVGLSAALLLSFPLALLMLVLAWREHSPVLALLASLLLGLASGYVLFGHVLVFRYLHPLLPTFVVLSALGLDRALLRRNSEPLGI